MSKNNKKSNTIFFIRSLAFLAVVLAIFIVLELVVYQKPSVHYGWDYIYNEDEDVDILIMGSSHVQHGIDAIYLNENLDKSTVLLTSKSQSIIQSYYNLVEVLKYKDPQLVVIESYSIIYPALEWMIDTQKEGLILTNLDNMKPSLSKYMSAYATLGFEGYSVFQIFRRTSRNEKLITAIKNPADTFNQVFNPIKWIMETTYGYYLSEPGEDISIDKYRDGLDTKIDLNFELPINNMIYLEKIITLCQKHDIELELIKVPVIKNAYYMSGNVALQKYLSDNDHDIAAINLMDEKHGIDLVASDFSDNNHLSRTGATKVAIWLTKRWQE